MKLVDWYRDQEERWYHSSAILVGDPDLQRLLSSWTHLSILTLPIRKGEIPKDERERWDWLWTKVDIPWNQLAQSAGFSEARTRALFDTLRGNRLIYPDGTAATHAISVLKAEVLVTLKKQVKGKGK